MSRRPVIQFTPRELSKLTPDELASIVLAESTHDELETADEWGDRWLREPAPIERWARAIGLLLCCVSTACMIGLGYWGILWILE